MEFSITLQSDLPQVLQQSPGMVIFELPNLGRSQVAYGIPENETLPVVGKYANLRNSVKTPMKTENHTDANVLALFFIFLRFYLFIYERQREREREVETQAEGEAGSMHREPDVGLEPGIPGSGPGPKAALNH